MKIIRPLPSQAFLLGRVVIVETNMFFTAWLGLQDRISQKSFRSSAILNLLLSHFLSLSLFLSFPPSLSLSIFLSYLSLASFLLRLASSVSRLASRVLCASILDSRMFQILIHFPRAGQKRGPTFWLIQISVIIRHNIFPRSSYTHFI